MNIYMYIYIYICIHIFIFDYSLIDFPGSSRIPSGFPINPSLGPLSSIWPQSGDYARIPLVEGICIEKRKEPNTLAAQRVGVLWFIAPRLWLLCKWLNVIQNIYNMNYGNSISNKIQNYSFVFFFFWKCWICGYVCLNCWCFLYYEFLYLLCFSYSVPFSLYIWKLKVLF